MSLSSTEPKLRIPFGNYGGIKRPTKWSFEVIPFFTKSKLLFRLKIIKKLFSFFIIDRLELFLDDILKNSSLLYLIEIVFNLLFRSTRCLGMGLWNSRSGRTSSTFFQTFATSPNVIW